jgi:hypothetical protein
MTSTIEQRHSRDGDGCLTAASIGFVAYLATISCTAVALALPALDVVGMVGLAFPSGLWCLFLVWVGVGLASFQTRLSLALLPGLVAGLLVFGASELSVQEKVIDYIAVVSLLPFSALPTMAIGWLGFRLIKFRTVDEEREYPVDPRPIQFSLRQLFTLTVLIAVLAFFGKSVVHEWSWEVATCTSLLAILSLSTSAVALISFGRRTPTLRLLVVAIVCGMIGFLFMQMSGKPLDLCIEFSVWAASNALTTGAAIMLYRWQGYRLVRLPPTQNASLEPTVEDVDPSTSTSIEHGTNSSRDCADIRG